MGFLVKRPPKLSSGATEFVREHPDEARVAVAVALETAAAQSGAERTRSPEDVPARLRRFVVDRTGAGLIGVTETTAVVEGAGRAPQGSAGIPVDAETLMRDDLRLRVRQAL